MLELTVKVRLGRRTPSSDGFSHGHRNAKSGFGNPLALGVSSADFSDLTMG